MPAVAAGTALVGTGLSIYGDLKSANDQAALDDTRASIAKQQAQELAGREASNEALRDQQASRQKLQFGASFAASGKAGTGVGSQLQLQNMADIQNMTSNRESKFSQMMLYEQAGIDTTLADQTRDAGTLSAIGAGIGGLSKAAGLGLGGGSNPGYGGTQSLGNYPAPSSPSLGVNTNIMGSGAYGGG